jgi:hypothetical protein
MHVDFSKDGKADHIKVSSKATPLLMILTTVALLLILQSATVLVVQSLDTALTVLIAFNLICAKQLVPLTLSLDANGLRCQRLVTSKRFLWDDISALKLAAAGVVSDAPRTDIRGRVGFGVVLRVAAKSTARDAKSQEAPTIVLFGADPQYGEKMLEIIECIRKFQAALNAKPQERWKKASQPQQQTQFRKKPNITMPA